MHAALQHRLSHYIVLACAWALLALPNLGAPSLWDMDEGLNAEAAREMYESGNWVVPRFNFQLRDAKPALLYWLQAAAYRAFGVNEFAARLPSAIALLVAGLTVYELGRSMFSPLAGLLASGGLMSSVLAAAMAHFANPDALLLACTSMTFLAFWRGFAPAEPGAAPRRSWFVPFGAACGLGMLAKGPVALALPGLTVLVFLAWQRQLRALWDRRLLHGAIAFWAVALPWYAMVTVETRGAFFRGFFIFNNVERFLAPDSSHRGPFYYHALVLLAGFAPWSVFLGPTMWFALKGAIWVARPESSKGVSRATPSEDSGRATQLAVHRLLICWFGCYLAFFTVAATKLPGYALPLYPAVALLTARFLDGWRRGEFRPPRVIMASSLLWLLAIGAGTTAAVLIVAGKWSLPWLPVRPMPGLAPHAGIGLVLGVSGVVAGLLAAKGRRGASLATVGSATVAFIAGVYGLGLTAYDAEKAPRELVHAACACQRDRDLRVGTFQYAQASLVFYAQREVYTFTDEAAAARFLACPTPARLFLSRIQWEELKDRLPGRVVASHWDMYRKCEIVVVSNENGRKPLGVLVQR